MSKHQLITVAGRVLFRQQLQTAKGTIFLSIEDETGVTNLILWKDVYAGKQATKEGQVLHVVARHIRNWSDKLRQLHSKQGTAPLPVKAATFDNK